MIPVVFTLAVFSLVWRQGNVELSYIPKLFEILITVVFILMALELVFSKEARTAVLRMRPIWKFYGALFAGLAIFMVVSTITSLISIPESSLFAKEIFFEHVRGIFVFFSFFVTAYAAFRYREKIPWFLGALTVSPLVFYLAFIPGLRGFFVGNARLIGAQNDPNYTASFIAVGLLIASVFYLYTKSRSKWFGVLYIILSMPLFLWADSRGMSLSIAAALILLSTFYFLQGLSWRRAGAILILFSFFVFSVSVAFLVLPQESRVSIFRRSIVPILSSDGLRNTIAEFIARDGVEVLSSPADDFYLSRGNLWGAAFRKTIKSPLGFGPAYHYWSPVEPGAVAHNLWIQVSLTAGWGGFILWLVFLGAVFRSAVQILKKRDFVGTALSISLLFLLISGMFIDIFTLRWLWLIIGIIVGYSILENNEITESIRTSADS